MLHLTEDELYNEALHYDSRITRSRFREALAHCQLESYLMDDEEGDPYPLYHVSSFDIKRLVRS
jgi:hypothetical protein